VRSMGRGDVTEREFERKDQELQRVNIELAQTQHQLNSAEERFTVLNTKVWPDCVLHQCSRA